MTEQNTTAAPADTTDAPKDALAPQDPAGQQAPTPVPAEDQKDAQKDAQEGTTAGDQQDALSKLRKEAAGHRVAAKEARAEADTLRAENEALLTRLTAAQDSILAGVLDNEGVSLDAFTAAGHRDSAFNQDGTLNHSVIHAGVRDAAKRFGMVRPATHIVNRETPPGSSHPSRASAWQGLLNPGPYRGGDGPIVNV